MSTIVTFQHEAALDQLDALWAENASRSSGPWTREQLHERS